MSILFDGVPIRVSNNLKHEILIKFKNMLKMKERGINFFFPDIDKLKQQMLDELAKEKSNLEIYS